MAEASQNFQEYRVTDSEDSASGNETPECKNEEGVLPDSTDDGSEHETTDSLPASESKRREQDP